MSEVPIDPITQLKSDHRTVESLFSRLEEAAATGDDRTEVLHEIVKELSVHAAVEEQVVYPLMRDVLPDGEAKVEEALAEHQRVKEILSSLEGSNPDEPEVLAVLRELMAEVRHHVGEEEEDLLPELREHIAPGEFTRMAERIETARKAAPTRPHPKAPSTPPGNVVAGTGAAMVDKARDAVRNLASTVMGKNRGDEGDAPES